MIQPISWELAVKSVNGNITGAKEVLTIFFKELPEFKFTINDAYQKNDQEKLYHQLHKLKGSCHFAGVPVLHEITSRFCEMAQKKQHDDLASVLQQFNLSCDAVIEAAKHFTFPE